MANQRTSNWRNGENFEGEQSRQQSYRVVWANEWDKYACQVYRKNFGEKELFEGDIHKVDPKDIPDFDMLVGGFPCQAFSLAGKRQGFKDIRGTLFFEIARIAEAKRPKVLLLENVKGLLSHDNGDTFETILRTLGNLGYWYEYQVLNSKFFGVPQNRERVFIVGHLREGCTRQVFPIGCDGEEDNGVGEVAGTLQGGGHSGGLHSNMTAISHSVRSGGRASLDRYSWDLVKVGDVWEGSQCRVYSPDGLAPTVHKSGGNTEPMVLLDNLGGNIKQRVKDASDNPAWTLGGSQTGVVSNQRIRRLTPVECERLQGFPDGWTEGVSDTQRYKQLGNAVTVNVIEYLGRLILESLNGGREMTKQ